MNKDFMRQILLSHSVSGFEETVQKQHMAFAESFASSQHVTNAGALVSVVNPDSPCRILLMGHADEIGFVVTHIQDNGMIRITRSGGVRPILYIGTPMLIKHVDAIQGDTYVKAVCVVDKSVLKKGSDAEDSDLLLDIGATSREDAGKAVSVGDPVCQDAGEVRELLNGNFSCKSLDDRTGTFVILEAAKLAKEKGAKAGIYAACTVGEETTGIGAYTSAGFSRPSCSIVVDVTFASDCPGTDPGSAGSVKLGEGPVLAHGSMVNKKMNALMETIAAEKNIPLQHEITTGRTFTDGDTVSKGQGGTPICLVSIPLRYMHSSVEVGNWQDLENAIELISEFILRMDENFDYRPF